LFNLNMKIDMKRLPQILFILMPLSMSWGQDVALDLHIRPDIHSKKVETVQASDPRLSEPAPVMDEAKAILGWQFADFSGSVEGYVPDAKIGKDLLPVDDTLIRAEPSNDGSVLGVYRFGDPIEVIDTGLWWKVRVETTFPVYFVVETPAAVVPLASEPEPALVDDPVAQVEETAVEEISSGTSVRSGPSLSRSSNPPRAGVVGQSYAGVFRQAKKRFGLLKPKGDYYLEGPDGKRLAWIELDSAVISGPVRQFLDQPVVIHGERVLSEKSSHWIIQAHNIRPN
jgi:hypothetical protein